MVSILWEILPFFLCFSYFPSVFPILKENQISRQVILEVKCYRKEGFKIYPNALPLKYLKYSN